MLDTGCGDFYDLEILISDIEIANDNVIVA